MAKKKPTIVNISCPKCERPLLILGNLVEPTKVTIQCPCGYTLKGQKHGLKQRIFTIYIRAVI